MFLSHQCFRLSLSLPLSQNQWRNNLGKGLKNHTHTHTPKRLKKNCPDRWMLENPPVTQERCSCCPQSKPGRAALLCELSAHPHAELSPAPPALSARTRPGSSRPASQGRQCLTQSRSRHLLAKRQTAVHLALFTVATSLSNLPSSSCRYKCLFNFLLSAVPNTLLTFNK